MTDEPPHPFNTLSVDLSLIGLGCRVAGRRRTAGLLLALVGLGYLGVLHERIAGTRISGYKRGNWEHFNYRQFFWHGVAGAVGVRWLMKPSPARSVTLPPGGTTATAKAGVTGEGVITKNCIFNPGTSSSMSTTLLKPSTTCG